MLLSKMIGLEVYCVYEGKYVGYITRAKICKKGKYILSFVVVNDEDDIEYEIFTHDVYVSGDNVLIKNDSAIKTLETIEHDESVINKKLISLSGQSLGDVDDMELNGNWRILNFVSKEQKFELKSILTVGRDVVVVNDAGKKISRNKFKLKEKVNLLPIEVSILEMDEKQSVKEDFAFSIKRESFENESDIQLPTKIVFNSQNNLLGKVSQTTVVGKNSEIVVKKGEIITSAVLERAKIHNALSKLY